jgi:hypothetical protein
MCGLRRHDGGARDERQDPMKKNRNKLPKGWTEGQVRALAKHYDEQSEDEAAAEDNAAYESRDVTMMAVPVKLVPEVQRLIAKRAR